MGNYAVIMAGGSGKRFWPYSRKENPKQCLKVITDKTLIEDTIDRMAPLVGKDNVYISTGTHLKSKMESLVPGIKYIVEPVPRNTAPCIALSCAELISKDKDAIVMFFPSDHFIKETKLFHNHLNAAIEEAKKGKICLIGIKPTRAATGYGYIHSENPKEQGSITICDVIGFKEKPNKETAESYLDSGDYLWNAGMFISRADVLLKEIEKYVPDLYEGIKELESQKFDMETKKIVFEKIKGIPIDTAVMEKSDLLSVIVGTFTWDDVGDWNAMTRVHIADKNNNIIKAKYLGDVKDSIIFSEKREIVTKGIKNIIIIDSPDCLLICEKKEFGKIKDIVDILEKDNSLKDYANHIVNNPINKLVEIDCKNIKVECSGIIATIGIENIKIKKDNNLVSIKKI